MTFGKLAAGLSTAPCLPQRSPLGRAIPAQKSHRRRQKHGCDQKANGDVMGSNVHNVVPAAKVSAGIVSSLWTFPDRTALFGR